MAMFVKSATQVNLGLRSRCPPITLLKKLGIVVDRLPIEPSVYEVKVILGMGPFILIVIHLKFQVRGDPGR
jgi:hypothetical protein